MTTAPLRQGAAVETRYLNAGGQRVPVEIQENPQGSVAARFFLGSGEAPIIDAPTKEAALKLVQCAIDVLMATGSGSRG